MTLTGYLAAQGFEAQLAEELGPEAVRHERLFLLEGPERPAAWALNVWRGIETIPIASIGEAAKALKARGRNWALYSFHLHRRANLIQAQLPKIAAKPIRFPTPLPKAPMGSWTLLDANTLLAAAECGNPFANGEPCFAEDKAGPPNRAYLKLWEALTLMNDWPKPGETCLDLGASPGGWTWVLAQLGAAVIAVDKAPLDPKIAAMPGVSQKSESAFALAPEDLPPVDWLFSDVICYPARLLALVEKWIASGRARNFVCTVKFQGATDHAAARAFQAILGAALRHLHHNKHELTFMLRL